MGKRREGLQKEKEIENRRERECESAHTSVYEAYFGIQEREKNLKENFQKKKTVVFRKRISAKTTVFLVFKSVSE